MSVLANVLSATILFAIPLLLVALGGMFSERSGVVNIALEGIMIIGALFACLTLSALNKSGFGPANPQLSMLIAIVVAAVSGALFSLLLAFAAIHLRADQTIGGTALNTFAPAFAVILAWAVQGRGQTTIMIPTWTRMGGIGSDAGFWETVFMKSLYLTTPIAIILLVVSIVVLYRTRFGMRLMACGEHPQAADSVGINVYKMRYAGVMISGAFAGIGGIAFSVAAGAGFQADVAGYGFLAMAVMIFGNWNPIRILGASFFFALFKVVGSYATSIPFLPNFENIASSQYLYQMLPYVVTMIVLIFTSKKSRAPKAVGIPYDKGVR